jgi:hypothetical protein
MMRNCLVHRLGIVADRDVDAKFIGCAEPALGEAKARELLGTLRNLDSLKNLAALLPNTFGLA